MKIDIETKEFLKSHQRFRTTSRKKTGSVLNRLASCCAGCDLAHAAKQQEDGGIGLFASGFQFFNHGISRPKFNSSLSGNR